jgi:hypothetical protein
MAGEGGAGGARTLYCPGDGCNDGNQCTSDSCNPANGACSNLAVQAGTVCDAGNGTCQAGDCVPTPRCQGVNCSDGNERTSDICNASTGACSNPNVANGTACDGGNGSCQSGACQANSTPPAAPSSLGASPLSSTEITVTWNDNSNNEDGFEVYEAVGSCAANFVKLGDLAANSETVRVHSLAPGTFHCYRVSAFNVAGESSFSNNASATTQSDAATLRIINDLNNIDQGANLWSMWNEVVHVRIGPHVDVLGAECNSVLNSDNYERLNRSSTGPLPGASIRPGYNSTPTIFTYEDFDVSNFTSGKYCVYLQAGWWEYQVGNPGWWEIHLSSAYNCAGQLVYGNKWNAFIATHDSGRFDANVSDWLPHFQWQGTGFCP